MAQVPPGYIRPCTHLAYVFLDEVRVWVIRMEGSHACDTSLDGGCSDQTVAVGKRDSLSA